jgi:malonyl-CoA/methylmalonyl-CoA synthetase
MTLTELFAASLAGRAAQTGLEWEGQAWTFGEIDARATRLARTLVARGLGRGDRLAVYLPNSPTFIDLFLACTRLGVVLVPMNILYREREATHILRDAEPAALVLDGDPPAREMPAVWPLEILCAEAAHASTDPLAPQAGDDDAAVLVYTSGTTGAAKGAVITHNNLAANAANLVTSWQFTSADRLLLSLPLFHVHGLANGLHCWLASGARMRLLPRFDRQAIEAELLAFRPTVFFGVPTMYTRLCETAPEPASRIGAAARLFVSGSAPLPPPVFAAFRERFGHDILERYGMTETLMTLSNPYAGRRLPGTVGRPLPGVSVRIVGAGGEDVSCGGEGELWVRSPTVCAGYWRRPDATTAAFAGGWFKTGDIATSDPHGAITLRGRRSDLVISGGFNIYPREIEEVLAEHPSVAEVAVAGVPDARRGEVLVAWIVPRRSDEPLDRQALDDWCRAALASFKVPRAFVEVASLPRTALGKVQKSALQEDWRRGD